METSNQTDDSAAPQEKPQEQAQQGESGANEQVGADTDTSAWKPSPPLRKAPAPSAAASPAPDRDGWLAEEPGKTSSVPAAVIRVKRVAPAETVPSGGMPAPSLEARATASKTAESQTPSPTSRRPILSDDSENTEAQGLPSRGAAAATSYMVSGVRHGNKRRSTGLFKLLSLLFLANLLVVGAFGAWLYNYFVGTMEQRMADFASRPMPVGAPAAPGGQSQSGGGAAPAELKQLQDDFEKRLADMKAQLQAAQSRLATAEGEQQQQLSRVNALATQVAHATTSGPSSKEMVVPAIVPGSATDGVISPSADEMILLKERNRLTGFADEAISTGAREPYERLWSALEDRRLVKLLHAARSEILRVQNFYLSGSRIDSYTIMVGDYFPENAALKDSQLKDEQLIELLKTKKHPWQVRMKAANLLGTRRSRAVGDALLEAVKHDDNLDVVKEATFSFEQMTGFRARIFEPASMEAWWAQYNAAPTSAQKKPARGEAEPPPLPQAPPPPPAMPPAEPLPQPTLRLPESDEEDGKKPQPAKKAEKKS